MNIKSRLTILLATALLALTLAGCSNLGLRVRTRWAAMTAPTCPVTVALWCTTPEEAGTVYYTGAPFTLPGTPTPFCRCPRSANAGIR